MTTRLLASFSALDRHPKDVLDKHARKNRLLSQFPVVCPCPEADLSLAINWDWDFNLPNARRTNIPKQKTVIDCAEQELQNSKIRCFMLRASNSSKVSSREDSTCRPGYTAKHSKVTLQPFTSPEDIISRISPVKDKENDIEGFAVVTLKRNSTSFKTIKQSPQRQKWSREVERIPPRGLGTENSRALLGGTLFYTDTSNWCSSLSPQHTSLTAFTEGKEQFSLSESAGKVVCQQLQQGNVVRVCTSHSRRNEDSSTIDSKREELSVRDESTAELVPLSLLDELEKKTVKILTPRAPSAYTPLPIVSETFPVLCGGDEYKHKPFSSSGFHTLDPSQQPTSSRRTVHSAIVRITESLQAEAIQKRQKETEEKLDFGALQEAVSQKHTVNLRVLSADRNFAKDTDFGQFSLCRKKLSTFPTSPPPTGKPPLELLEAPCIPLTSPLMVSPIQRCGSSKEVGPVLNGMNPNEAETSVRPQESFRPLLSGTRKRLIRSTHYSNHKEPANSQRNNITFHLLSKPLQNNTINLNQFVSHKQLHKRSLNVLEQRARNSYVIPEEVERMTIGANGVSFFHTRSNRRNKYNKCTTSVAMRSLSLFHSSDSYTEPPFTPHPEQEPKSHSVAVGAVEDSSRKSANTHFDLEQAINIPTAENTNGQ